MYGSDGSFAIVVGLVFFGIILVAQVLEYYIEREWK